MGDVVCEDTCGQYSVLGSGTATFVELSSDGHCDDGGDNSYYALCWSGTDCTDCGKRQLSCTLVCTTIAVSSPTSKQIYDECAALQPTGTCFHTALNPLDGAVGSFLCSCQSLE